MDHEKLSNALESLAKPKTRYGFLVYRNERSPLPWVTLTELPVYEGDPSWNLVISTGHGDQEHSDNLQDWRADRRGGSRLLPWTRPRWQNPLAGSSCLEGLWGSFPGFQRSPGGPAPSAQHWAGLAGLTLLFGPGMHSPFPLALSFPKRIFRPFFIIFFLFSPQVRIKKLAIWNTPNFHWLFYMIPQVTRT